MPPLKLHSTDSVKNGYLFPDCLGLTIREYNVFRYQLHDTVHHFSLHYSWAIFFVSLIGFLHIESK
ncbi:Uncharacterised protein [Klebsiella pneumoniae]|uniref:Uncharacterized protein n=1 Tax=Klebsiella quasipneumoniae TaxID=1463165 RepID=A0A6M4NRH3_9ENTR|nr:hypothetical protein SM73_05241 [Klebsiella quasipneumoniae]QJS00392.1 hypothetical protein [Klebsiella quasipneumoniae]SVO86574.1 Uncharacterised protein [Klebsiella pneumoniae]